MAAITQRDKLIRERWRAFLAPLVGLGRAVSIVNLEAALSKATERSGDNRAEIYAYLRGTQTPRVQRVFQVGEALRECGIDWCSGPLALFAAGYVEAFLDALVEKVEQDRERDALLLLLVAEPSIAGADTTRDRARALLERLSQGEAPKASGKRPVGDVWQVARLWAASTERLPEDRLRIALLNVISFGDQRLHNADLVRQGREIRDQWRETALRRQADEHAAATEFPDPVSARSWEEPADRVEAARRRAAQRATTTKAEERKP